MVPLINLQENSTARTIALWSTLMVSSVAAGFAQPSKPMILRRAAAVINRLVQYSIAAGTRHDPEPGRSVERLFGSEDDPEVLRMVAVTSRTLSYPGMAENQYVDQFLDAATWVALGRIGRTPGQRADDALVDFKELTRLDGGSALTYEEIVGERYRTLGIPEASWARMRNRTLGAR